MKKTKGLLITGLAGLAALLPMGGAMADTYVKQGSGGNLLSNPYLTSGTIGNPLTEIDGLFSTTSSTSTSGLPDLFLLDITGAGLFSATTVGTAGTAYDTSLFLFSATGLGDFYNEIDGSQQLAPGFFVGAGSTLPAVSLPAGLYYLGISPEGTTPQSAGGNIFPYPLADGVDPTAVYTATGVGGSQPLSKWNITADDVDSGSYTIQLTGAAIAVPEPAPLALLGLGLLPLALLARRRTSSARPASSERTHA